MSYKDGCREVVSILGPEEIIKCKVIRVINNIKLWIFGIFVLIYFQKSIRQFCFWIFLEVLFIFAENFGSSLRITSNVLFIHSPDRLEKVQDSKDRSLFSYYLGWTFD
jgi:hypothetical protein